MLRSFVCIYMIWVFLAFFWVRGNTERRVRRYVNGKPSVPRKKSEQLRSRPPFGAVCSDGFRIWNRIEAQ